MANGKTSFTLVDDFGRTWIFEKVPVEKLRVDEKLQRPIGKKHLASMSGENFDPEALRPLCVSIRKNGYYYILDGQNRFLAGKSQVRFFICQVYVGLTRKQEGRLFVKLNNASKVNPNDKFRVRLNAGESWERDVQATVMRHGLTLKLTPTHVRTGEFNQIGALGVIQKIVNVYGLPHLDDTLYIITRLFDLGNGIVMRDALKDMFLLGMAQALDDAADWDRDDVVEAMTIADPTRREEFLEDVTKHTSGIATRRGDVAPNVRKWFTDRLRRAAA